MGIFKDYKELYESVQPETPVDKTTSASEIMSLGWGLCFLLLWPACTYFAWCFFSSPLLLGGILDFMLPPLWLFMTFGIICGVVFALRVLSIRDAQTQAYLKNGGNPRRLL